MNLVVVLRRVLHFATYANNLCRFDNMLKHNWIFYNVNSVAIRLLSKQPCKSLWYFYVCYTDDHIMSKKRKSTTRDEVEWRDCCSLHAVTRLLWSFTVHTNGKCYLFVLYNKNWNGLSKDLGARKKKSGPLTRSDEADFLSSVCVRPLTDHDQQPMKVDTAVKLLHNIGYIANGWSPCISYI